MAPHAEHQSQDVKRRRGFNSTSNFVLVMFLAIAGFFLFTEHRAHLFGWLPFLILLACPLLHVFMHRGHSDDHEQHGAHKNDR